MSDNTITPSFSGEIQFAGWTDSHISGPKVSFWLQSAADLDVFRMLTARKGNQAGQRFMAVLVEVGDDELPVPAPVAVTGNPITEKPKMGPLAYWLVLRCNEPQFWYWLLEIGYDCHNAKEAGDAVKDLLGLQSRKDLDDNPDCVDLFHKDIRGPYSKYLAARGITQ